MTLELVFSSEKREWASQAIADFTAARPNTSSGHPIAVHASYTGSVEPIASIVSGSLRAHVFSPASSLVLPILNDRWTAAHGASSRAIAGSGDQLVLSPVVIAMWQNMAEALGWPARPIGWSDVARLALDPRGWAGAGHPEWGAFRFGHTHPGYSNSGLIAVMAENYAGVHKVRGLSVEDVNLPATRDFVRNIESSVVHYGRSTGLFFDELSQHGPGYLSAAVLYENLVTTSARTANLPFPLVCVYPHEGTAWADHPYVVLDVPWATADTRDAAERLRTYLLSRPVQERAMTVYGFRPANTDIALAAPIDAAHGADPRQPHTLLTSPDPRVLSAILDSWHETKRNVEVLLVLDRSGSMEGERIRGAREGLLQFLTSLQASDRVSLLTFNNVVEPQSPWGPPQSVSSRVRGVFAGGGTALYDAVLQAYTLERRQADLDRTRIHAVVVLTDGEDTNSTITLDALAARLRPPESGDPVRIFTIGYGEQASASVLQRIARGTGGAYYHGDTSNIRAVYDEIASFF